jgi:hypothetical protein
MSHGRAKGDNTMGRGLSWVVAGLLAWLLTGALPVAAQKAECRNDQDLRCWFIIGEAYKKPTRAAFIARHVDHAVVNGMRSLELVQVVEAANHPDRYAIWQMQVDCRRRMFRVSSDKAVNSEGLVRDDGPSYAAEWTPLGAAKYGESVAEHFACDPEVVKQRTEYLAAFIGTMYRVPDVVAFFRQTIWEEGRGR